MKTTVLVVGTSRSAPAGSLSTRERAQLAALAGRQRRRQWLTSRQALRVLLGLLGLPRDTASCRFPNPRVSLAYAGRRAVAAGSITLPSAGIGIDLAADRSADPRTARFFLDDMEKAWLAATPTRARATEFTRLRTVKGAVFKADLANRTAVLSDYTIRPVGGRVGLGRRRGTGQHFGFSSAQFQGAHLSVAAASGRPDAYPIRRGRLAPVTFENVAERVSGTLKVPAAGLTPETTVRELAADSFHLAEIAVDLSEEFETVFAQAELREVVSLGQLVSLLRASDRRPGP